MLPSRLGVVEMMDEKTVQDFWQNHACGDALVMVVAGRFVVEAGRLYSCHTCR